MQTSIVVFYMNEFGESKYCAFEGDNILTEALKSAEDLRKRGMRHVCLSSENVNSVGKPGVDVTGKDYNWKKRR